MPFDDDYSNHCVWDFERFIDCRKSYHTCFTDPLSKVDAWAIFTMSPLRIAILIHTDDPIPHRMMRESFERIFESIAPGSKLDFFNLLLSPELPMLTEEPTYDLVILGGTTYPPKPGVAWMQNLKDFEHKLNSVYTKQKVMGICLGHQTLAILNGSIMGYSGEPEVSLYLCWNNIEDWATLKEYAYRRNS